MPYYGGPDVGINYRYVAVQPFDAEHPIGSGNVVHYEPGDEFPGEDWGRAAHNLVEAEKAVRLATNITPKNPTLGPPPEASQVTEEENQGDEEHPFHQGFGWYMLSDGSRVRGKDAALEAQSSLDEGGAE